jgi:hypothetical protein
MTFRFRAHHPSAYKKFLIFLIVLAAVNVFFISLLFPGMSDLNQMATDSVILILPYAVLLLLPSILFSVMVYRWQQITCRLTLSEAEIQVEQVKKSGAVMREKKIPWSQLISVRVVDFEDNHYCNLRFTERKYDLVIHRESGDFQNFLNALAEFAPDAIKIAD